MTKEEFKHGVKFCFREHLKDPLMPRYKYIQEEIMGDKIDLLKFGEEKINIQIEEEGFFAFRHICGMPLKSIVYKFEWMEVVR